MALLTDLKANADQTASLLPRNCCAFYNLPLVGVFYLEWRSASLIL